LRRSREDRLSLRDAVRLGISRGSGGDSGLSPTAIEIGQLLEVIRGCLLTLPRERHKEFVALLILRVRGDWRCVPGCGHRLWRTIKFPTPTASHAEFELCLHSHSL
jgi:hypothetical protein